LFPCGPFLRKVISGGFSNWDSTPFKQLQKWKIDGTGNHHISEISQAKKDKYHMFSHIWNLDLKKKMTQV
jgi:hypothetical protein